jgi:hypothetical protein
VTSDSQHAKMRTMCHDLNNDLSAAAAYADFLIMDTASDHPNYATLQKLLNAVEQARKIAGDLHQACKVPG